MKAWLLIYALGYSYGFLVPGIATQAECERLRVALTSANAVVQGHCIEYLAAQESK